MDVPKRARWLPWGAAAVVVLFAVLVGRFWHPVYGFTAFLQLDASRHAVAVEAVKQLPVYVYRDTGGYDGLFYAQLATDPALRDPRLIGAMDNLSYRARRILPPAAAWLLGAGRPDRVIAAYTVLNILVWLALAALLWPVLAVHDARGWLAWTGVLLSAGALCSVRLALTDLTGCALVTLGIAAAERMRKFTALGSIAAAALARDTSLLGVAGLVKPPWISAKNALRLVIASGPLVAWMLYVRWAAGAADQGLGNFTLPLAGWILKAREIITEPTWTNDPLLALTTLLAFVGLTAQAAHLVLRRDLQDRWWRVGAVYVGLMAMLGTAVWEDHPGAATRVLLPLTVAFNVRAVRTRSALTWLLIGNLTVFSGILALRNVPRDAGEVAAHRDGPVACLAHVGGGWHDGEQSRHHRWWWTGRDGTMQIEAWPRTEAGVTLTFDLRALSPRTVELLQDGTVIWTGAIGVKRQTFHVPARVRGGRSVFTWRSDAAPLPEHGTAGGRQLSFALYDFSVRVQEQ